MIELIKQPQVQALIAALVVAIYHAFQKSKQATFLAKAHEALVVGIEASDCENCRKAAAEAANRLGIAPAAQLAIAAVVSKTQA